MRMRTISHARHFYPSLSFFLPDALSKKSVGDEFQARGLASCLLVMTRNARGQQAEAKKHQLMKATKRPKAKETKQEGKHKRFDLAFHLAALRDKIASRHRRQKSSQSILAQTKNQLLEKLPLSVCFSPFLLLSKELQK